MFFWEFCEISKNTFFTKHLRVTASAFSFTEAAARGALWKNVFLKISQNLQENTLGLWNFQKKKTFLQNTSGYYFWLFRAMLLKWVTANSVWKNSDEYSLHRNTSLRSTAQLYHFFLGSINLQCMFSLVYTVYCQKQPSE